MSQPRPRSYNEEPNKIPIPRIFQETGSDAVEALWRVANQVLVAENEAVRNECSQREAALQEKYHQTLTVIENQSKEILELKRSVESLTRENKALDNDLESKSVQLEVNHAQLVELNEKTRVLEQEVKRLSEERGRSLEALESLQRRHEETLRQFDYQEEKQHKLQEEVTVAVRQRERVETALESVQADQESFRDRIKQELSRAVAAEAVQQELRENIKKAEQDLKELKEELHERRTAVESEVKIRQETEKKTALLSGQLEALERAYREQYSKLEQELNASKAELMTVRNRMIKAEGALERETKRVERLENKLIAGGVTGR